MTGSINENLFEYRIKHFKNINFKDQGESSKFKIVYHD